MQSTTEAHGEAIAVTDLLPIEALAATNPKALSVSGLRWQLRHRGSNGLSVCCVKVGKRVLISLSRYERWLATQVGA